MSSPPISISDAQKQQYRDEGYMILERVIPDQTLQILREECARGMDELDAAMDRLGVDTLDLTHRNNRYFITMQMHESPKLRAFLFSDLMAEICRATLGSEANLFWEQYVVKAAERGMKFGWHQDSGYVNSQHEPYLTCWCPLDDVNEENGTISLLPYPRAGTRDWVSHRKEEGSNDMIGYDGDDPGIVANVPAGSIVAFSSTVFHRSGPNQTDQMRRVYVPQYAKAVIHGADGSPFGLATPFLRDGRIVAQET